jgi:Mitochondrial ribosomal protein subunit L20
METRTMTWITRRLAQSCLSNQGALQRRSHQVASRTKRALNIAPHQSFLPSTSPISQTEIILNPPASEPSVYHTPLKFLPKNDPKRRAYLGTLYKDATAAASNSSETRLPPEMESPKMGKYHLTPEDVAEIRRLRDDDPVTWSINNLAKKFQCAPVFIATVARTPRDHKATMEARLERVKSRWGPRKTKARNERKKRKEMLYSGEL